MEGPAHFFVRALHVRGAMIPFRLRHASHVIVFRVVGLCVIDYYVPIDSFVGAVSGPPLHTAFKIQIVFFEALTGNEGTVRDPAL